MDNPRPEKVAVVAEVRQRLESSRAAILTEYRGLGVQEMASLRRALSEAGGEYKVYKNTLVRFAVGELGLSELEAMLEGPTAIAFVNEDAVTVARALRDFSRIHPELVVKGGVLGQSVLTASDAGALAEIPPRPVLLARLAGGLAAPLTQLAGLLEALPRSFAYGLKALIDKSGGPSPVEPSPVEPDPQASVEGQPPGDHPVSDGQTPDPHTPDNHVPHNQ
ncbi:MAG: 50S ribosomal protein L10 [Actinomycetota bacterium]|nr:50S ribosomal protein L10 [Actinomycetota bacterium]